LGGIENGGPGLGFDLLVLICALVLQRPTPGASTTRSLRSRSVRRAIFSPCATVLISGDMTLSKFCDSILIEHLGLPELGLGGLLITCLVEFMNETSLDAVGFLFQKIGCLDLMELAFELGCG